MQQIINFDIALNYLPYRYRHRSNTRSKRIKVSLQRKSYSRSKIQKSTAVKNIQSSNSPYKRLQNSPFSEDFIGEEGNRMKVGHYFELGEQQEGFDRLQYSKTPSPLREQQQQELQQTPNSQFSFSKQLQQPQTAPNMIKLDNQPHRIFQKIQNQYKPFSLDIKKQSSLHSSSKRDEQEIFNQQDMKEIRQALMNKIKQNQFKIADQQKEQEKVMPQCVKQIGQMQPSQSLKEVSGSTEQISFDDRYNRLQALNQHSEEHYEKQRKTKIIEIMKKGEKSAQNYYNKHNKRIKDGHQQRLNNFNQSSINTYSNIQNNHYIFISPPSEASEFIHKIPITNEKSIKKAEQNTKGTPISPKPNVNNSHRFADHIKQQSNNYSSLQTSSASQKQQSSPSQKYNQNEANSSYQMMKKSSSKKLQINPLIQDCLSPELFIKNNITKQENVSHYKNLQKTSTQIPKEQARAVPSEESQAFSSILANFSIPTSNNAIRELKQARSKQKQQLVHSKQEVDSSNRAEFSSGYSNKNTVLLIGTGFSNSIHGSQSGYAVNMKKKKQLTKLVQSRNCDSFKNCSNLPQAPAETSNINTGKTEQRPCQIIKEDSVQNIGSSSEEYEPKYTLTKQGQFMIKLQPSLHDSNSKRQNGAIQEQANRQQIHLTLQARQQLLQAHLQLCFTPRSNIQSSPLPSNRASQSQFSLPISHILSNERGSEHKMEENDRILRMMMRDQDIGQLSSFAQAEDNQTSRQANSSMTQELCEIINSNEDNNSISSNSGSNLPQQTSGSAIQMQQINNNELELFQKDTYREGPLESKHNIFNEQILNVLNMQDQYQDECSQIPSQGMQVSLRSQNVSSSSLLAYKNHFHPSQAIHKFKHSKHNSADVRNKSINSFANTHSQSAKKRIQVLSESSKKAKSRRQMNATRFKTRLTSN